MFNKKKFELLILFVLIPLLGFIADFASKLWIINNVCMENLSISVFPFLNIVCVLNTGVSFGMFAGMENGANILLIVTTIILVIIYVLMHKENDLWVKYGYSLVISGAFGNIIDRFLHKGVIDFLDFYYKSLHYPAFNVADSLVFIGVCIIIGRQFFVKKESN